MTSSSKIADESLSTRHQPWPIRAGEILLIGMVFFTLAGDPPPHVNETHYLCRLKHYWNPEWCDGDLFLESTDTQLLFIWLFGWVTKWFSLPAAAWIVRVISWMFLAWAWQRLSWRLVPRPLAAVLSAALFVTLNALAHLAGEWVVGGVEAKCFAYGFVLLALYELVERRWNRLWLLLGAATAFHPLVGGWSVLICGALWLLNGRRNTRLVSILPGLAGGLLLGLVGILPAVSLTWNQPADVVTEANRIYVFDRLPHHLAMLALPQDELMARISRHAVLLLALAALGRAVRLTETRRMVQFAWGAALLALAGFAIELTLSRDPLLAARLQRYYWYRLTDFGAPMAVALASTTLIAGGFARQKKVAAWVLLAALLLSGGFLMRVAWQRFQNPVPPADARMRDFNAWVDVCNWVAANTSAGALFLTPRLNHSFKWRTGRPEVAIRKDIPQDARSILEWHRRLKDIFYEEDSQDFANPIRSLGYLGSERVRDVALNYGADYVLAERDQLLRLPVVYRNEEYIVYRIENSVAGSSR